MLMLAQQVVSSWFFAPKDVFPACGMFTAGHMILLALSIVALGCLVFFTRKVTEQQVLHLTKSMAIGITVFELIKIGFNFYWGYTWLDAWAPISYCSIFIYALWCSGYGKGTLKNMGDGYIAGTAIIAGGAFLLVPSTSLMQYPMWHFLSIYSMLFHVAMMYMGIMYLRNRRIGLNKARFFAFSKLFFGFAGIAILLNIGMGSNLMILREPFNIPVDMVQQLYHKSPWAYTILAVIVYWIVPYGVTLFVCNRIMKRKKSS